MNLNEISLETEIFLKCQLSLPASYIHTAIEYLILIQIKIGKRGKVKIKPNKSLKSTTDTLESRGFK